MLSIHDFDYIKALGSGSFGEVYLAEDKKTKKLFAVKRLNKANLRRSRQLDNTYNEAKLLKEVFKCPFVINYYDLIETETEIFMFLEYIRGGELFFYMKRHRRFPQKAVRFFACEILAALGYMHENSILYRDLKPENILIGIDGHIKLADFGFATKINEASAILCGTPEYIAPEKLKGVGDSKASDYWSLGCLLYEMVCGSPPFKDKDNDKDKTYENIMKHKIEFSNGTEVSPLQDLILRLLDKNEKTRLGTGGLHEITGHCFFKDVSWEDVQEQKLQPPFLPELYQFAEPGLGDGMDRGDDYFEPHGFYKRIFREKE